MTRLILEKELRGTGEDSTETRALARAQTLTVLERLNPSRKTSVVLFLTEADLIQGVQGEPTIPLFEANLAGAQLNNTYLAGADLHDAKIVGADLSEADLTGADLYSAFERTDLSEANLKSNLVPVWSNYYFLTIRKMAQMYAHPPYPNAPQCRKVPTLAPLVVVQ